MTASVLSDIILRCQQRHENPLKQRKTISVPQPYKGLPYHFTVYCAHRYPVMLQDLEAAGISFMPSGRAPGSDRPPRSFGGDRFLKRQQTANWDTVQWLKSWGIHVYTGMPSARDDAPWHDVDFKYEALCAAPDAVLACVQALVDAVANPLLTISNSGGLRFSCRIPGYLHPNTKRSRLYVYKGTPTAENPHQHDAYVEIFGEKGHTCWDGRAEILLGDLLDPPVIPQEVLFAPIDALRTVLHEPGPQTLQYIENPSEVPYSLGSNKLDLAKEAFFKRGFSYLRQENGCHYWHRQGSESGNTEVSLWENERGVWICASTSDIGLPMEATLITEVWEDTGILLPIPATGLPVDDKVPAIREGTLSPLAIKRPAPVLHKSRPTEDIHETREKISVQVQRAFDRNVRVLGFISDVDAEKEGEVESFLQNSAVIYAQDSELAAEAEQFFQKRNVGSVTRWRDRMYLWDEVKDIPIDVRMATPFERGNVCEDAQRCEVLEKKGGNPTEIICPHCRVYTACQARGYLSQFSILQTTKTQILEDFRLFLNPQYGKIVERLLEKRDGTHPLCIINVLRENALFLQCELSKTELEEWVANWRGSALGNLAILLLNAVGIRDKTHAHSIKRLRTVMQTFEWLEGQIIQQMCHVKVEDRSDPDWTFWHQLKRFFAHYTRDADAPMQWDGEVLRFWVPPVLHPSVRHLLVTSPALYGEHLHRTFFDSETEILPTEPITWVPGNRVFQIRTGIYPRETILDISNTWDVLGVSETGQHIFWRIQAEIERDPNIKHGIITHVYTMGQLKDIVKHENICFLTDFRRVKGLETAFQEAEVIWIVGVPEIEPHAILERTQILFGNDEEPLSYQMEPELYRYKDERVQSVYEKTATCIFTQIMELAQLNRLPNKKIMLITGLRIPNITDRPETLLFDWADFDVAGDLDKLADVIATRQRFETERENLTAESSRKEVERVLGCSTRQANRILVKMRGGKIIRVTFREQILALLADGEKKTPELTAAIQGHPKAINTELTRLVGRGEIVKIRRGLYRLPEPENG